MSGLVFASMIKARLRLPVVLNVSCRDRNRFALKSDLLGAAALGIDAVVALSGDKIPPGARRHGDRCADIDAFGLLAMIADLNRGDTGEGSRRSRRCRGWLRARSRIRTGKISNASSNCSSARPRRARAS